MLVGKVLLRIRRKNNTVGAAYMHFTVVKGRNKHWRLVGLQAMTRRRKKMKFIALRMTTMMFTMPMMMMFTTPMMHAGKVGACENAPRVVACPSQLHCPILLVPSYLSYLSCPILLVKSYLSCLFVKEIHMPKSEKFYYPISPFLAYGSGLLCLEPACCVLEYYD